MKQRTYIRITNPAPLLCLFIFLMSCIAEKEYFDPENPQPPGEEIAFTLKMPVETATTRALSEMDENQVDTVSVLVFRESDKQFVELLTTGDIETELDSVNLKKFYVRLRGDAAMDLVLLGNSQDIIREVFPDEEEMQGLTKNEILEKLVLSYEGAWVDGSGKPIRPFPMWGFRDNVKKDSDFTGENAIRMTRMVVRIDVHVLEGARDDFQLTEIYLYNSYTKGKVAHSTVQGWNSTEHKATAPDIPAGATTSCPNQPFCRIDYIDNPSPITTPGISSERVIYTLEAPAGSEDNLLGATALVVGGLYENDTYYYRVDFTEKNAQGVHEFIPLIRNHNYEINIHEVKGKGYTDPDEAFRKGMTNMELDIVAWDGANMGNITFGAQHQLVVNTDSFFFYSNGRAQILKVFTDFPDGWEVEMEQDPEKAHDLSWLTIDPLSGDSGVQMDVTLSAQVLAIPESDREGYFYIRTGNLRKKIKVYQTLEDELYLEVEPNLLVFRKSATSPETVIVTVDPIDRPVYISWAGSSELEWELFPRTGLVGETEYVFQPKVNNTRNLLSGVVSVTITDDTGKSVTRTISVLQMPTDSRFDVEYEQNKYPALGGTNFWMLFSSEASWQIPAANITLNGSTTQILTPHDNYVTHEKGNYTYSFDLEPNPTFAERVIDLLVVSEEPDFAPVSVPVTQDYTRPLIEILSPTSQRFDFTSAEPAPVNVTFKVNTNWSVTTNLGGVIADVSVPLSTVHPGGTIHNPDSFTVTFTPRIFKPEPGTPAAETRIPSVSASFRTEDHAPAAVSSKSVTFYQEVPYFFDRSSLVIRRTDSDTGEVIQDGETFPSGEVISVFPESKNNTAWSIGAIHYRDGVRIENDANASLSLSPKAWGIQRGTLEIPSIQSFQGDSLYFFLANYIETVGETLVVRKSEEEPFLATYHQPEYYVEEVTWVPELDDIIPRSGGTYTITIKGNFPNVGSNLQKPYQGVYLYAGTSRPNSYNSTMVVPGTSDTVTKDITIDYNSSTTEREIHIYLCKNDTNSQTSLNWELIHTIRQRGIEPN